MKRANKSILDFMRKKQKNSSSEQDDAPLHLPTTVVGPQTLLEVQTTSSEPSLVNVGETENMNEIIPDCWTAYQYKEFQRKYDGLVVGDKTIGCSHCSKVSSDDISFKAVGVRVSKEWQTSKVFAIGANKVNQQASLRKKMSRHFNSDTHREVVKLLKKKNSGNTGDLINCVDQMNENQHNTTSRVFRTVYNLAKNNRPMADIEQQVRLQQLNGIDMGVGLHSRQTATRIVEHIGLEIKKNMFDKVINRNSKISIIIDEASTVSCKPVLIVFVKFEARDYSPVAFFDLVELEKQDSQSIYSTLLKSLSQGGFTMEYLRKNLVGFCSDGASVMLGRKSGVGARLKKDFPNIVLWHCLNHRLQLALDDAVRDIKQLNHFKFFMDKLYSLFHQSNKNQLQLSSISTELDLEVRKIGRILGPRWAACSLRSAMAVYKDYPALVKMFSEEEKFNGLASRLLNLNFFKDLCIMIEILQELNVLSTGLQARSTTLPKAEKLIKRTLNALEMLKTSKGKFETGMDDILGSDALKGYNFYTSKNFITLPRQALLEAVMKNLRNRLLIENNSVSTSSVFETSLDIFNLLEPSTWDLEKVQVPWKDAEEKLDDLSRVLHYEIDINDFRDYVESVIKNSDIIPDSIRKAKDIMQTFPISSAEAERGFSLMNLIATDIRNSISTHNICYLISIVMLGQPLELWDPTPHVKTWLRNHHTADDPRLKRGLKTDYSENQRAIWNFVA